MSTSFILTMRCWKTAGETILSALNSSSEINQNLKPVLYRQQLDYWLSYFKGKYWLMAVIALTLGVFVFFKGNTTSKAMFITGFSATGMEILLLFGLQVFFGNIYLLTSIIFTGFMLGLAVGSFFGKSSKYFSEKKFLPVTQLSIGVFAAVTGLVLFSPEMSDLMPVIVYSLYLSATILIGILTGLQFTQVSLTRTWQLCKYFRKNILLRFIWLCSGGTYINTFSDSQSGYSFISTNNCHNQFCIWNLVTFKEKIETEDLRV